MVRSGSRRRRSSFLGHRRDPRRGTVKTRAAPEFFSLCTTITGHKMLFVHWHLGPSLEISSEPCKAERLLALTTGHSTMDRIASFRSFIAKSPSDPFPRYGLAMELKGNGELA